MNENLCSNQGHQFNADVMKNWVDYLEYQDQIWKDKYRTTRATLDGTYIALSLRV